jgi:hypothetical protein
VREVLVRHGHVEEAADGLPAVTRVVDEQSRGRNRIDDGLVVLFEYALGMGAIFEATLEGPLEIVRELSEFTANVSLRGTPILAQLRKGRFDG